MTSDPPSIPGRGPLDFDDDPRRGEPEPVTSGSAPVRDSEPTASRERKPPASRVRVPRGPAWIVGVAGVVLLIVVTVNSIRTGGAPPGLTEGSRLPEFAAPLVTSRFPAGRDAVDLGDGGRSACRLRGPQVFNVCDLRDRGPMVLAFFAVDGRDCLRELDVLDRLRARHPAVGVAAVAVHAERDAVAPVVRRRGWGFPVAYDADGRLASRYRVVTCPQLVFARRGGEVIETTFRRLDEAELRPLLRSLAGER